MFLTQKNLKKSALPKRTVHGRCEPRPAGKGRLRAARALRVGRGGQRLAPVALRRRARAARGLNPLPGDEQQFHYPRETDYPHAISTGASVINSTSATGGTARKLENYIPGILGGRHETTG